MVQRNVVIVSARCGRNGSGFGIRLERRGVGQWAATWAFPMAPAAAAREGYDRTTVDGRFGFDPAYPGCPHCGGKSLVKCGCGASACHDGRSRTATCPACHQTGELGGPVTSLSAGGDR